MDEGRSYRPPKAYIDPDCGRCPHGRTLHTENGHCFSTGCECPGYEPDLTHPLRVPAEPESAQTATPSEIDKLDQELRETTTGMVIESEDPVAVDQEFGPPDELPELRDMDLPKTEVLRSSPQGGHYKQFPIEPIQYIVQNNLPYHEANVVKYVTRWRLKGGLDDLKKARWYLTHLIDEVESGRMR